MSYLWNPKNWFPLSGKPAYIVLAIITILWIIIVRLFFPRETIPYVFEQFLTIQPNPSSVIQMALPLFIVGFVINFFKMASTTNPPEVHQNASDIPLEGFTTSLIAGVFEEITFRWVLLYGFMGLFWTLDQILRSMTGSAILENLSSLLLWWVPKLMIDAGNSILDHPGTWTIALAILCSNWKFQEGHLYQGLLGFIMSGFGGLVFFRITLNNGLPAAIITHFLFDLMIFVMLYIDVILEMNTGDTSAKNKIYHWYAISTNLKKE